MEEGLYNFQRVKAWQKSHDYVLSVYLVTKHFPNEEKFGLTSQFRRAAVSIAANIAEGYRKLSKSDKLRFFNISQGSLEECRYYNFLSRDLEYIDDNEFNMLKMKIDDTSRLLNTYCDAIIKNQGIYDY